MGDLIYGSVPDRYSYTAMTLRYVADSEILGNTFFSRAFLRHVRSLPLPCLLSRSRLSLTTRMYLPTIPSFLQVLLLSLAFCRTTSANVTVYGYAGPVTTTVSGAQPAYTGLQAYNPILLSAPPLPSPAPSNAFNVGN